MKDTMTFTPTAIPDVIEIKPVVHGDDRGFFMEVWREDLFKTHCGDVHFVQTNHSLSGENILRGLHYQTSQTQGKLVRVIRGEVFDVAVDMRRSSRTFGQWVGTHLSAANKKSMWVPEGFAHGFYVVSDQAEVVYACTDYYHPQSEVTLRWNDPDIGVEWPIPEGATPLVSARDRQGLAFQDAPVFP